MTAARLLNVQPDMHAADRTLLGGTAFPAALSVKRLCGNTLQPRASIITLSIVSYYADFVNMLLCDFRRIYCTL